MKWMWMMNYCKEHELPPAQSWAWERAEKAYNEYILLTPNKY